MDSPPDEYLEFARAAFEHRECRARLEEQAGEGSYASRIPRHGLDSVDCGHNVPFWLVPVEDR